MHVTPTFITEALCLVTQVGVAFNDCYSELTTYTALDYSYWVSFHDVFHLITIMTAAAIYKSYRTCLTNHMEFTSDHITSLVINSLGADTLKHTHTHIHT